MAATYVRFAIVDLNGKELSKVVPERHRDATVFMYSGALAMGANATVLTFPEEVGNAGCPNWALIPDWSTEQELPWASSDGVIVKRVYCEQLREGLPKQINSKLNQAVPRTVCSRLLEELREQGLQFFSGGELEFTLCRKNDKGDWKPEFDGVDIFATLQNCKAEAYFYKLDRDMLPLGIDIQTYNCEYGTGQIEITFAPKFGIEALDGIATFRTGAKEIATLAGMRATFMAKPFGVKGVGNGGHFNFSLWSNEAQPTSAMHSTEDESGLSSKAKSFLAGILKHAPAIEAICSPTPPCYTRHGNWAPVVANWGHEDRTACVRVKADPKGSASSCYMELRMPSAAANAYLVAACVVAAGLDGLKQSMELPNARLDKDGGAAVLPTTLPEALETLENDAYMKAKLGEDFVRWFSTVKRAEIKSIDEKIAQGGGSDDAISAAWQEMFMEYI